MLGVLRAGVGRSRRAYAALLAVVLMAGFIFTVADAKKASSATAPTLPTLSGAKEGKAVPTDTAAPTNDGTRAPAPPANVRYNRPTLSDSDYAAAKAVANNAPVQAKPSAPADPTSLLPLTIGGGGGPGGVYNFEGDSQGGPGGGWVPPDTHGATGNNQYVEVTNSDITAWSLATNPPTLLFNTSLNSFLGGSSTSYFDPRAIYHPIYNRWFIVSAAFEQTNGVQPLSIRVTNSPNIASGGCTYTVNTHALTSGTAFWDYNQVGFDHDALMLTANIFDPGFVYAAAQFWPLAEMTSCLGLSYWEINGFSGTLAPPMVYDRNAISYLTAFVGTGINVWGVRDTGRIPPSVVSGVFVDTADQGSPPNADQNASIDKIDTIDGRFQNASTQVGDYLYQVHTRPLGSFAATQWYKINTASSSLVKDCTFFASNTSDDFNPSITANGSGDVFLNWSATRVTTAANTQARAAGIEATDATTSCAGMTQVAYGVGQEYGNGNSNVDVLRWGDYSAIFMKFNQKRAMAVNEIIAPSGGTGVGSVWTTKIAQVQFA